MARYCDLEVRIPSKSGLELQSGVISRLRVPDNDLSFGGLAANDYARARGSVPLAHFTGENYIAAMRTETLASGTIAMGVDGLLFTTAASTDAVVSASKRTVTPAGGMYYKKVVRAQTATVTTTGLRVGLFSTTTTPFTNVNDLVCIGNPTAASAALTATVRGNGGAAADLTSFVTDNNGTTGAVSRVAATDMELGFEFYVDTVTTSWGNWLVNGYKTPFSAAQITQLVAILTSPPAMYDIDAILPDGSARTGIFQYSFAHSMRQS